MAGFTQTFAQTVLDTHFPISGASEFVGYSANGTTETGSMPRTAVGATGWAAATAAQPSVKANDEALTTAAATGAVTLTHFAVFTESAAGVQMTDWQALTTPKTFAIGETGTWPAGSLTISLD